MTEDDKILADILRRGLSNEGFSYWFLHGEVWPKRFTIDGYLELTDAELAALDRFLNETDWR